MQDHTPPTDYPVPGLAEEVEILVDRWGVPHIYARSARDAYVAQGFNAARDRLVARDGPVGYVDHPRPARDAVHCGFRAGGRAAVGVVMKRVLLILSADRDGDTTRIPITPV